MRVLVAGASGVIGVRLVPLLAAAGHEVAAMTRTPPKLAGLRGLGAEPVLCDALDARALRDVVTAARPEAVVHLLTDLPDDPARLPAHAAANARIRREGTRNLLAAARAAGSERLVAESVAWPLPGDAGAAVRELEEAVLGAGGVVLRYGRLYGPGTYHEGEPPPPPRVHVDEAARRTVPALDAAPGVLLVVEEPAPNLDLRPGPSRAR
jgi:nucleoside-diphosphate-sugar epimerase